MISRFYTLYSWWKKGFREAFFAYLSVCDREERIIERKWKRVSERKREREFSIEKQFEQWWMASNQDFLMDWDFCSRNETNLHLNKQTDYLVSFSTIGFKGWSLANTGTSFWEENIKISKILFYTNCITIKKGTIFQKLDWKGSVRFAENVCAKKSAEPLQSVDDNLPNYNLLNYLLIL